MIKTPGLKFSFCFKVSSHLESTQSLCGGLTMCWRLLAWKWIILTVIFNNAPAPDITTLAMSFIWPATPPSLLAGCQALGTVDRLNYRFACAAHYFHPDYYTWTFSKLRSWGNIEKKKATLTCVCDFSALEQLVVADERGADVLGCTGTEKNISTWLHFQDIQYSI